MISSLFWNADVPSWHNVYTELILDMFELNSDETKLEVRHNYFWEGFLESISYSRKVKIAESPSSGQFFLCRMDSLVWFVGFVDVSVEIALSLSYRNTLLVSKCNFQNLCWCLMKFLDVCSDCQQPVKYPHYGKGALFMISWSLTYRNSHSTLLWNPH